jgi:hydrogenase maturation protein HypF
LRFRVSITGIVQGVGFRPNVHKLAERFGIRGWVLNNSSGVTMEIEPPPGGGKNELTRFLLALKDEAPPLAKILTIEAIELPAVGFAGFEIRDSERLPGELTLISPDVALCADCKAELFDPGDRRHLYPFINCTNCGPRYSIIRSIPYDRPNTTMAAFTMCDACAAEYSDVGDRRYHAQPDCCPACGPSVELVDFTGVKIAGGESDETGAIAVCARMILDGKIVAIKGVGGFHLACDASNPAAVGLLRARKRRARAKPFAVMVRDLKSALEICDVSELEASLISSTAAPIMLLKRARLERHPVASEVAPGQSRLGVMIAYAPLHHVIFHWLERLRVSPLESKDTRLDKAGVPRSIILVMTSANISEEPLVSQNREALEKLSGLADALLMHNRDIHAKCDDSVARVVSGRIQLIRHSRGFSPHPVSFASDGPQVLGVGAEKKNTFALSRGRFGFLSPHMGDMENLETMRFFEETLEHYKSLFSIEPEAVACDLHPDYLATKWAEEYTARNGLPLYRVQHHHAHMASVLAEHGEAGPALGVSFDGTGYGPDGTLWGGEFLWGGLSDYRRFGKFFPLKLPGGEGAIKEPWRVALAALSTLDDGELAGAARSLLEKRLSADAIPVDKIADVRRMIDRNANCVATSSCGRLFDAISALVGLCHTASYEGQAAMLLEEAMGDPLAWRGELDPYRWRWREARPTEAIAGFLSSEDGGGHPPPIVLDWRPLVEDACKDLLSGLSLARISARFHLAIVDIVCDAAFRAHTVLGAEIVALSGGCFQNAFLVEEITRRLPKTRFRVLTGSLVPPNDAGVSLGQVASARAAIGKSGAQG